jgi:hypothetical protein
MLKSLLGVASLFLALNFNGVVHAEVNAAIPSTGGKYFDSRVEIPVPAFAQDDPRWANVRPQLSVIASPDLISYLPKTTSRLASTRGALAGSSKLQ